MDSTFKSKKKERSRRSTNDEKIKIKKQSGLYCHLGATLNVGQQK